MGENILSAENKPIQQAALVDQVLAICEDMKQLLSQLKATGEGKKA